MKKKNNMNIFGDIETIKPFFIKMISDATSVYYLMNFPKHWQIFPFTNDSDENIVNIEKVNNGYVFFVNNLDLISTLIEHINRVIKYNQELEDKKNLLKEKCDELIVLFEKNDIATLQKLTFVFKTPQKQNKKSKTVEVVEEVENIKQQLKTVDELNEILK